MARSNDKIILLVSEFPPSPGGIGNHAFNLALYLSKNAEVTVVTEYDIRTKLEDKRGLSIPFRVVRLHRKGFLPVLYLQRIFKAFQFGLSATHIIACDRFGHWNAALLSCFYRKPKYTAITHGGDINSTNPIFRYLTKISLSYRMDFIVSVSEYTRKFLPPNLKSVQRRTVIPNGVNVPELDPYSQSLKEKSINTLRMITIGSLSDRKGQANVIKALPTILTKYPALTYTMIGKPVIDTELTELAEKLEVKEYIEIRGMLNTTEMFDELKESDLFIMLSQHDKTGDFEGFGIAILEANFFGIPAIGSKGNGIEQAIRPGYNGELVNASSPSEVLEAVNRILSQKSLYAENARNWALQHDWNLIGARYLEMWAT
jgi:phosphatidylinositol alpha-1,6-mannosyltransferase